MEMTGPSGDCAAARRWKKVHVEHRVSVPDPTISQQLALTGVGVALLSRSAVLHDVELGLLMRLLPDWEPESV